MNDFDYRIIEAHGNDGSDSMNLSAIIIDNPSYVGTIFDYGDIRFVESALEGGDFAVTYDISFRTNRENQLTEEETNALYSASNQLLQQILEHILNESLTAGEKIIAVEHGLSS